jgi:hypothetical protein
LAGVRSRAAVRKIVCTGGNWNFTPLPKVCGGEDRKAEMSNWMSDGAVAAIARSGTKASGPAASSAATAAASTPAWRSAVRRVIRPRESTKASPHLCRSGDGTGNALNTNQSASTSAAWSGT